MKIFTKSLCVNLLKVSMITLFMIFYQSISSAQKIYKDYEDGGIYFKLRNDVFIDIRSVNDKVNIDDLTFLRDIRAKYQIQEVVKPFYSAKTVELDRTYRLEFTDHKNVDNIIRDLSSDALIEYAEKVPLHYVCYTPNDPSFANNQWYLKKIGAEKAWDISKGDPNITVAIVDNAVALKHPDLAANAWVNPKEIAGNGKDDDNNGYIDDINGWDTGGNDNNPNPTNTAMNHGTHCAGDAAAVADNSTGIASIGFNVSIIGVKCTKDAGSTSSIEKGYEGITYAAAAGARVISCSWGGSGSSQTGQTVVTNAFNKGCIVIAAAGNDNVQTKFYPAGFNNVISVASSDNADKKSSFSNYGTWIDITSPGTGIYSTVPNTGYSNMSGTSMATPLAAGLCGLMLSKNPSLTPTQIENCLKSSATKIDNLNPSYTGKLGAGRINAEAALKCVAAMTNNAPVANFKADVTTTCTGKVNFTDQSTNTPTTWAWDFGDGGSSTVQNPSHTYTTSGTFTVKLSATNTGGNNVETKNAYITVSLPQTPAVIGAKKCGPGMVDLSASAPAGTLNWYAAAVGGTILSTGTTYSPNLTTTTVFYVENSTGVGCVSRREPVTGIIHALPAVPTVTQSGDNLVSSIADGYQWNLDGVPITGETNNTFTPTKSGKYSVTITDQNGCSSTSDLYDYVATGIKTHVNEKGLRAFPNPTTGKLFIETNFKSPNKIEVSVLNMIGATTLSKIIENAGGLQQHELNISSLPAGIYLVRIVSGNQLWYNKITKE